MGVPEFDPRTASAAKESASLLRFSQMRLGSLLTEIQAVAPSLAACGFKVAFLKQHSVDRNSEKETLRLQPMGGSTPSQKVDDVAMAVAAIAPALGLDMEALRTLVVNTQEALARISR